MTSERTWDFGFVVLMSLGGLASGLLTAALSGGHFSYDLGIPFGAITAFLLAITGVTRSASRLLCLVLLTAGTFIVSVFLAMGLVVAAGSRLIGTPDTIHPIALFAGGMTGGFIILSGALFLSQPKMRFRATAWNALRWSPLVGALAPVAWALGPSFGMRIWSVLHAAGLTSPTNTPQHALYGETGYGAPNRLFALFVVWQTGMAFALALNLRPSRTKRKGVEAT